MLTGLLRRTMDDEMLQVIQVMLQKILDNQTDHTEKFGEVLSRLKRLEAHLSGIHEDFTGLFARVDRVSDRLDRIIGRLR
jgi:predicted nuclease with TOPRIM domain